jgi:DNA-directed RNA polymerase subunit RPC12/RpoP
VSGATSRWKRDVGIAELIEYLDQPKFTISTPKGPVENPDALSSSDWKLIYKECDRCQDDFLYAAKNYFWITTKETGDQLFTLWESQELILELMWSLRDKGLAQKLIILKSRQMGISTLCEALVAWRTMLFPNVNALVVGPDLNRSEYLFSIMLHIYDQMPWWLKPMCANRKYDGGLLFANPDPNFRRTNPGLKSRIEIQMAQQYSGIGQGIRVTCAHVSEISDWPEKVARQAIDGDLGRALADRSPMTFALVESTAKGAGTYYEDLWRTNKEAGDDAEYRTVFIPAFMEHGRRRKYSLGWEPKKPEIQMRELIKDSWTRCDNPECGRWFESVHMGTLIRGEKCLQCKTGTLNPYVLDKEQLREIEWLRVTAERKGIQSVKELRQELCQTDLESFQLSGDPVFPEDVIDFAVKCVRKPIIKINGRECPSVGFLDKKGKFHGVCYEVKNESGSAYKSQCWQDWCTADHRFDDIQLRIWEFPEPGQVYFMGVDVAEGLGGKHDYSVISVIRLGKGANADAQVAVWRSNTVNHYDLAIQVVHLGYWYNTAQANIEYNTYQTCGDAVRIQYNYPSLHRWKHLDHQSINSTSWHWITNGNTKPKLWGDMVRRLRAGLFYPRSDNFVEEMKRFQKSDEDSDKKAEAEAGSKDDELIGTMIASYCAHETDYDPTLGYNIIRGTRDETAQRIYHMTCLRCGYEFDDDELPNGRNIRCEQCSSILLKARKNGENVATGSVRVDMLKIEETASSEPQGPDYDTL